MQRMVELSDPSAKCFLTFGLVLSLHEKDVGCGFCRSGPSPFLSAARENLITLHDISSSSFHSCSLKSWLEAATDPYVVVELGDSLLK